MYYNNLYKKNDAKFAKNIHLCNLLTENIDKT